MTMNFLRRASVGATGLLLAGALIASVPPTYAQKIKADRPGGGGDPTTLSSQTLPNLKTPLSARVKTSLHVESAKPGAEFTAQIPQTIRYQTGLLPKGSYLVGQLERARPSRRFGRPGYFQLRIEGVVYPDGERVSLAEANSGKEKRADVMRRRLYHPKAKRAGGILKNNLASTTVGAATTITLTALGTVAFPYALGARVAAGAIYEGVAGDRSRGLGKRLAIGGFRGTGVPGVYNFLRKQPTPVFELDDPIEIRLSASQAQTLFAARVNPDVSWGDAGFENLDWTQPKALNDYAELARQLERAPGPPTQLTQTPPADGETSSAAEVSDAPASAL